MRHDPNVDEAASVSELERAIRDEIARLGRNVADLSARHAPANPGPRPLSRAAANWTASKSHRKRE
ncbi:MAG: hypothetical protein FWD69_12720 [Polyangiaceae bacterium]|nr:hypothetical protein [Polyangiaceae bacterium]